MTHSGMLYRLDISTFYFYGALLFQIFVPALLRKRLWHKCFPGNFARFLGTPFLTEHLQWLLLKNLDPSLFTVNSHADNHVYKYIYLFWILHSIKSFETPLLLFLIKTMLYRKKYFFSVDYVIIIELQTLLFE